MLLEMATSLRNSQNFVKKYTLMASRSHPVFRIVLKEVQIQEHKAVTFL